MSLQSDIQDVFDAMAGGAKGNDYFCEQLASVIAGFANGCTLTCLPATLSGADASPSGTFSGSGTASWTVSGDEIEAKLKAACSSMQSSGDDNTLASAFADGLDADAPVFTISIDGATTVPGSPPVSTPSSDSGVATAVFNSSAVETSLNTCFNNMKSMSSGGDNAFAAALATAIQTYYTTAVISFKGASHLSAVAGTITVTPGS